MTTPIQLEAIKIFGRKELSRWCFLKVNWIITICTDWPYYENEWKLYARNYEKSPEENIIEDFEILGNLPHLEDLFRVAKERWFACIWMWQFPLSTEYFMSVQKNIWESVEIDFNPDVSLLDQHNLEEIINLFKNA